MFPAKILSPLFAAALVATGAHAASDAKPPETFALNRIDSYLAGYAPQKGNVGLSVAIVRNGQLVLAKGYGMRSLEKKSPVQTDTLFAIGSVTKQFTCACIFLLAEEGKLTVTDKLSKYIPKLSRADEITLLDLMNHTSGYPDYYPLDFVDTRMQKPISPEQLLAQYAGGKLDFEPGTDWSYSNTGYIVLGRVIEKVSGQPFAQFLTQRILKPLHLEHTAFEPEPNDPRLAVGYASFALSPPEPCAAEAKGWIGAAGGIFSTATDMASWDLALMNGKLLRADSLKMMTTSRKLPHEQDAGYACGLSIRLQERRVVWRHTGAVSGFNAFNAMVPATKSAVVVLCNKEEGLGNVPDRLLALLLKQDNNVPKIAAPSASEVVKIVFNELQEGKVERQKFGAEFNLFLSDAKLAGAAKRLKPFGKPKSVDVLQSRERGGMEVTTTRLTFRTGKLDALMYRQPDGKIEQFFISEP
jgi:D-alanyl-D-alanine carboxypeptidase